MSSLPFVSSETHVFYENSWNSSLHRIHLLGRDFCAYSKGFKLFEHIPYSSHFLWEWNEISWLVDDHKRRLSLHKVFEHGKHDVRSLLAVWKVCVSSLCYALLYTYMKLCPLIVRIVNADNRRTFGWCVRNGTSVFHTVTPCYNTKFLVTQPQHRWQYLWQ